jgi:ribulose-phosphate 3-epimerase
LRPIRVLPSLLSADFARLAGELARCAAAGASMVHVDVMDGHFVPNLTVGPVVVAAIRRCTRLHLDVHLMLDEPLRFLADFRAAGADAITIHVEALGQAGLAAAIAAVRAIGAQVGLALNPGTDPAPWFPHFAAVDLVMFMTVNPGFGGQAFIPEVRPRLRAARAAFPDLSLQVDGGINRDTIPLVVADGADRLVTGQAFFKDPDPGAFLRWAESINRS